MTMTLSALAPKFGNATPILDRNHSSILNAVPVMSKAAKTPVLVQEVKTEGFANTLWGTQAKAKAGDLAVFYGFDQNKETGELKADINVVDRATFLATYAFQQGGATLQQAGQQPPSEGQFTAFKTRAPHKLHIPQPGETRILSKEGEAVVPAGQVIVVDGTGDPYTNKAARGLSNFEPVTANDVDSSNQPFSADQVAASNGIFPAIKQHFNLFA